MKLYRHAFQLILTCYLAYLSYEQYTIGNMSACYGWLFSSIANALLWLKEIEEAKYREILDTLVELGEYYENEEEEGEDDR